MQENKVVSPGWKSGTVIDEGGQVLTPPVGWVYLPAGDGPLTRKVKSRTVCWQVQMQVGRRTISKGIWADGAIVMAAQEEIAGIRQSPDHVRKQATARARRERKQEAYVEDFYAAVLAFLNFHPRYSTLAGRLARAVTEHATPVGSGTVARTERIPLDRRAEAAVIAWLRHQTTAYDRMRIARVKGERRQVRRQLAQRSKELLAQYRQGGRTTLDCPLQKALGRREGEGEKP